MGDPTNGERHRVSRWVYAGDQRIRHTAAMRGAWSWDATCSCGWDSRTGGGTRRYVDEKVADHKAAPSSFR